MYDNWLVAPGFRSDIKVQEPAPIAVSLVVRDVYAKWQGDCNARDAERRDAFVSNHR
jgi:hypothetical protein